jgi:uridylate kinase
MLKDLADKVQIYVVCGGGKTARYYASVAAELGGTVDQMDLLGIGATRMNAGLLGLALGDWCYPDIPLTVEEAAKKGGKGKIVVMGGTEPGHTTDGVTALLAREVKADRIINATSVDAVYSDDPRANGHAERYSEITIDRLEELVYGRHRASRSGVFDPLGVQVAKESRIDIYVVYGRDLNDLKSAILGEKIKGTVVRSH